MALLLERSNDALKINPPGATHALTVHGSDWLWAVTAIYIFSFLIVVGFAYFARSGEKIFHYLFTISLFIGSISYFAMASDIGWTAIKVSENSAGTRQIFYPRYINWFFGWTPLITAIGLISGVSWATIVYNITLSWIWVASWLSGSLVATNYKWGFFAFGTCAYFLLSASLLHSGSITAKRVGIDRHYLAITAWLVFIWLLYPIAYGVDDGGNKISVTSGFVFFGILDLLSIPLLTFGILFLSRSWDYRSLNLYFTQYGRVAQGAEFPEREKVAPVDNPPVVESSQAV